MNCFESHIFKVPPRSHFHAQYTQTHCPDLKKKERKKEKTKSIDLVGLQI